MRLIDADELKKALAEMWYESAISITGVSVSELIDKAPTIEPIEDTKSCGVSADRHTDQNVADVPIGDTISRADAVDVVHKYFVEALDNEPHEIDEDGDDVFTDMKSVNALLHHNKYVSKALKALPSANRPTENFCRDCPIYSADRPKVNSDSAEEQIAETEQKSNRPKGDPETEPASVVAYICDRRRCAICSGPDGGCDHTTDIKHAAHFKNVAGQYFERPYMEEDDG